MGLADSKAVNSRLLPSDWLWRFLLRSLVNCQHKDKIGRMCSDLYIQIYHYLLIFSSVNLQVCVESDVDYQLASKPVMMYLVIVHIWL